MAARTPNAGDPRTTECLALDLDQAREFTDGWLVKQYDEDHPQQSLGICHRASIATHASRANFFFDGARYLIERAYAAA
jgi:hypothetical protein